MKFTRCLIQGSFINMYTYWQLLATHVDHSLCGILLDIIVTSNATMYLVYYYICIKPIVVVYPGRAVF